VYEKIYKRIARTRCGGIVFSYGGYEKIKFPLAGGNHSHITKLIKDFQIDTSHFTGKLWSKGKKGLYKKGAKEFLVIGGERRQSNNILKRCLIEIGRKYECVECKIQDSYNGKPIVLEIDHINNNWADNTAENLQFICPNCHSQKTKLDGSIKKAKKQFNKVPKIKTQKIRKSRKTKIKWPTKEELQKLIWEKPTIKIAKEFGVSDKAIEKQCKKHGISKPPRGYWAKLK
jgi:5-methylcytosine-specific restriction endonuclease McrA